MDKYGGFLSHGVPPNHHLSEWDCPLETKHFWIPPWLWKPPYDEIWLKTPRWSWICQSCRSSGVTCGSTAETADGLSMDLYRGYTNGLSMDFPEDFDFLDFFKVHPMLGSTSKYVVEVELWEFWMRIQAQDHVDIYYTLTSKQLDFHMTLLETKTTAI